ncbi:hypothetical protein B0T18DRAFT_425589 [Schizothecium vesticola]|uniref:Fucose-specific lectin n=1 Tax=Schizothecium vesticola TaxID=314040 RepID=A0AA40F4C8_9PEZI|nr:hypothetical protein B0T18DRAFT_425589 [Schizothecium vesticola]
MNVYGVLSVASGTTTTLMPCRLSPGFLPMNLTTHPMLSGYGLGACSDGKNTGFLFYLANVSKSQVGIYKTTITSQQNSPPAPTPVSSFAFQVNPTSRLGAVYGNLADTAGPTAYVVFQDSQNALHLAASDGTLNLLVTPAGNPAMANTPVAYFPLGNQLIVYYFNSEATTIVYRVNILSALKQAEHQTLSEMPTPNGHTQLTAVLNPATVVTNSSGTSGTAFVSYIANGGGSIGTWADEVTTAS